MRRTWWLRGAASIALGWLGAGGPVQADGYPPFYGYSTYFGGPAPYFSLETDVQQATAFPGGDPGFGTRTYYRGGPFWTYRPARARGAFTGPRERRTRRSAVLRRKG